MQSALAPWLSAQHPPTQAPANASHRGTQPQRQILCNGITQFPVWISEQQRRGTLYSHGRGRCNCYRSNHSYTVVSSSLTHNADNCLIATAMPVVTDSRISRPHPLRHRTSRPHMYVVRLHHHFKTAVAVQVTTPMGQYQDGHVGWRLRMPQNVLLWLLRLHHHFQTAV
jgi:hypothetical protein